MAPNSSSGRGGRTGGLVGAATGFLSRTRGNLSSMLERGATTRPADTDSAEAGTRPTTGAEDPLRRGDLAPSDPGLRPDIPPTG
jgi:hypothetical protein